MYSYAKNRIHVSLHTAGIFFPALHSIPLNTNNYLRGRQHKKKKTSGKDLESIYTDNRRCVQNLSIKEKILDETIYSVILSTTDISKLFSPLDST